MKLTGTVIHITLMTSVTYRHSTQYDFQMASVMYRHSNPHYVYMTLIWLNGMIVLHACITEHCRNTGGFSHYEYMHVYAGTQEYACMCAGSHACLC